MTPGNMVSMALINGLDVIAITDHCSARNCGAAMACAEFLKKEHGKAPLVIPGMEVEVAEGFHVLCLFPTLEKALETLLRAPVPVTGAGRTDTGVSASYYVAHFDFDGPVSRPLGRAETLDCAQLRYKLNAILPKSVSVSAIEPVEPEFHARFSAKRRRYAYFLHRTKDPFVERCSYFFGYPGVDFEAMNEAAQLLLGTHDFSCFEKSGGDNKTSVCTVYDARWVPYEPVLHAPLPAASPALYWRFEIEADRFLRNMVRAVVGTLLEVGRGRRPLREFEALILPPDVAEGVKVSRRSLAGESAPGHALFLTDVRY